MCDPKPAFWPFTSLVSVRDETLALTLSVFFLDMKVMVKPMGRGHHLQNARRIFQYFF